LGSNVVKENEYLCSTAEDGEEEDELLLLQTRRRRRTAANAPPASIGVGTAAPLRLRRLFLLLG